MPVRYCCYCSTPLHGSRETRDHVLPKSRLQFHENVPTHRNLVPCCRPCNMEKDNLYLSEWLIVIAHELERDDLPEHRRMLLWERKRNVEEMKIDYAYAFWPRANSVRPVQLKAPKPKTPPPRPKAPPPPRPPQLRKVTGMPIRKPRFLKSYAAGVADTEMGE